MIMETACLHLRGKAKSSHLSTRCCQERQLLASTDVDVKIVMVNFAKVNAFILNLCLGWNPFIVTIVRSLSGFILPLGKWKLCTIYLVCAFLELKPIRIYS